MAVQSWVLQGSFCLVLFPAALGCAPVCVLTFPTAELGAGTLSAVLCRAAAAGFAQTRNINQRSSELLCHAAAWAMGSL